MDERRRKKLLPGGISFLIAAALTYIAPPFLRSDDVNDYPSFVGEVIDRRVEQFYDHRMTRYYECAIYFKDQGRFFFSSREREGICNGLLTLIGRKDVELWHLPTVGENGGMQILQAKVRGEVTFHFDKNYSKEDSDNAKMYVVALMSTLGLILIVTWAFSERESA